MKKKQSLPKKIISAIIILTLTIMSVATFSSFANAEVFGYQGNSDFSTYTQATYLSLTPYNLTDEYVNVKNITVAVANTGTPAADLCLGIYNSTTLLANTTLTVPESTTKTNC